MTAECDRLEDCWSSDRAGSSMLADLAVQAEAWLSSPDLHLHLFRNNLTRRVIPTAATKTIFSIGAATSVRSPMRRRVLVTRQILVGNGWINRCAPVLPACGSDVGRRVLRRPHAHARLSTRATRPWLIPAHTVACTSSSSTRKRADYCSEGRDDRAPIHATAMVCRSKTWHLLIRCARSAKSTRFVCWCPRARQRSADERCRAATRNSRARARPYSVAELGSDARLCRDCGQGHRCHRQR